MATPSQMADPNAYHVFPGDEVGGGPGQGKEINLEPTTEECEKEAYLHPCCQKELESTRVRTKLMTKLRAVDITRHAMDRRKGVVGLSEEQQQQLQHQHAHGAGCCALMVDYPALACLRESRGGGVGGRRKEEEMEGRRSSSSKVVASYEEGEDEDEDEEEDSDDELLRELEAGDDGGFLEIRRAEMMRQAQESADIQFLGIGLHTDLPPSRVLDLVYLRCCHLVIHCYDPHGGMSAALDLQLERLTSQYPGTRFVRTPFGGGEGLRQALRVPPSSGSELQKSVLLCVRDGCLIDSCYDYGRRFGDGREGGREDGEVYVEAVEQWLRQCQVLERERMDVARARKMRLLLTPQTRREGGKGGRKGVGVRLAMRGRGQERDEEVEGGEEDEDEDEKFYECGLEGCYKAFIHSHVGMEGINMPKEFGAIGEL